MSYNFPLNSQLDKRGIQPYFIFYEMLVSDRDNCFDGIKTFGSLSIVNTKEKTSYPVIPLNLIVFITALRGI